jgi:hypothetical protein
VVFSYELEHKLVNGHVWGAASDEALVPTDED